MGKLIAAAIIALVFVVAGCSDSSGPGDVDGAEYPDIPGLVAFYQFDGNLDDSSENGHDGTGTAGIFYVSDHNGAASSAVYVDGSNNRVSIANRGAFDFVGAFTVAGWIMPGLGDYTYACVIDKGYADGDWSVGTNGADSLAVHPLYFYVGTHSHSFSVNDAVPVGQDVWTHFACSFNDTTNVAMLYVNGAFAVSDTYGIAITPSGRDLWIGTSHWGDSYTGAIDQVAIFGRVLSGAEVSELYDFD